jgi:hypothetical protein
MLHRRHATSHRTGVVMGDEKRVMVEKKDLKSKQLKAEAGKK